MLIADPKKAGRRSLPSRASYEQPHGHIAAASSSTLELGAAHSTSSCESSTSAASSSTSSGRSQHEKPHHISFKPSFRQPVLHVGKFRRSPSCASDHSESSESSENSEAHSEYSVDDLSAPPSFAIPSYSKIRQQKLRVLRKRFGEDVPVDVLFPQGSSSDDELKESDQGTDEGVQSPATSTPLYEERISLRPQPWRSQFVHPGTKDEEKRARVVTVHYADAGTHGFESETFKGLTITCRRITTIPEE